MEMFLEFWQSWPVFVTALVTLGVTIYAFLNSQSPTATMVYQVITMMAFILALPAVLIHPSLSLELVDLSDTIERAILWLNLIGGIVALASFLLSILGVGKERPFSPAVAAHQNRAAANFGPIGQPQVGIGQPQVGIGQPQVGIGQPQVGIGQPQVGIGQTQNFHSPVPPTDKASSQQLHVPTEHVGLSGTVNRPTGTQQLSTQFSGTQAASHAISEPESDATILLRPKSKSQYFAWLVQLNGPRRGQTYALTRTRNKIGRGKDSHIKLENKSVSSEHAILLRDEEQKVFMLQDTASSNGTYLHGQPVYQRQPVKDKDRIKFGESEFYFLEVRLDELSSDENNAQKQSAQQAAQPVSLGQKSIKTVVLEPGAVDDS